MGTQAYRYGIGALAERTGSNVETVRYYERIGLMPSPPRTDGGHRKYSEQHVRRMGFIRRSRELGFSIDEVRDLLSLVDKGDYACWEVREIATIRRDDIREKIADLRRMEVVLSRMISECEGKSVPDCPILDSLGLPGEESGIH